MALDLDAVVDLDTPAYDLDGLANAPSARFDGGGSFTAAGTVISIREPGGSPWPKRPRKEWIPFVVNGTAFADGGGELEAEGIVLRPVRSLARFRASGQLAAAGVVTPRPKRRPASRVIEGEASFRGGGSKAALGIERHPALIRGTATFVATAELESVGYRQNIVVQLADASYRMSEPDDDLEAILLLI